MKTKLCDFSTLLQKHKMKCLYKGIELLVFEYLGKAYAMKDKCPHQGTSLQTSLYQDGVIKCKEHGLEIDVTTGCVKNHQKADFLRIPLEDREVRTYPLIIEEGIVYVDDDFKN